MEKIDNEVELERKLYNEIYEDMSKKSIEEIERFVEDIKKEILKKE